MRKDDCLTSVAKRLTKALLSYYKRQPVKSGAVSWSRFFSETDRDGSGVLSFAEMEQAVRERLRAKVSRYELRVFWRRVDANGSGQASLQEFTRTMYMIEVSTWPDISDSELDQTVKTLNAAAEKWHRAGGNWFKIFNAIDTDESGALSFDELRQCVRGSFPGLRLKESELPEKCVQGLWKMLDFNGDIEIPVYRFMSFMRKNGAMHSMHKLTVYSQRKRGLEKMREELPEAPERSRGEVRGTLAEMERALQAYFGERGLHNQGSSEGNWVRFFKETDVDGSGRLTYVEFRDAVQAKLRKWLTIGQEEWRAFWDVLDPDKSMEVSSKELLLAIYRLDVDAWPDDDDATLQATVEILNEALLTRLRSGGNWYKAFNLVDKDGSGRVEFQEFKDLIRDTWRGLAIRPAALPDQRIKAFWKKLDENLSGDVTVAEFMVFMKRHGGPKCSMHRLTEYSKKKRGLVEEAHDYSEEIANAPSFSNAELCTVATRLTMAINSWLLSRGLRVDPHHPRLWGQLIEQVDTDKSTRLSFPEYLKAVRRVLGIGEDLVSADHLRAFWRAVDADGTGESSAAEFDRAVYCLQIETWPVLRAKDIKRVIEVMNNAAEKWHRAGGNWYKVFTACDEDGSGNMAFEELVGVVRKGFPGLSIGPKQLSDDDLRGLWRAVDSDRSGLADVKEFMAFMRTHGRDFSMHKLTKYSQKLRGLTRVPDKLGEPPERSRDQLRATARALNEVLGAFWRKRCVSISQNEMWNRFFSEADVNANSRLTFSELETALRFRINRRPGLRSSVGDAMAAASSCFADASETFDEEGNFSLAVPEDPPDPLNSPSRAGMAAAAAGEGVEAEEQPVVKGVTRGDLHALWVCCFADADGSREVTAREWHRGLYRLEVEVWPDADEAALASVVDRISTAADKWHRAGGNWYKVFNLVDADSSGRLGFQELLDIIRRPLPCLAVSAKRISDAELRSLWKALDTDLSGDVCVTEFMVFMRRLEVKRGVSHSPTMAAGSVAHRARMSSLEASAAATREPTGEEVALLVRRLREHSRDSVAEAYQRLGLHWDGSISEWDFIRVIREVLGISGELLDEDAVHGLWSSLDISGEGAVDVEVFLAMGH